MPEENATTAVLKNEIANMKEAMKQINESLKDTNDDVKAGFERVYALLNEQSAKNDQKYASKWAETSLRWTITIIIAAIIGALLKLVII